MLTHLAVEDYQALATAELELGKFTVVTGPTGSGKSAVVRALRAVAFNAKGTSFIRHGRKSCQVMVADDAGLAVVLVKGSRDAYVIDVLGQTEKFTKLGGQVPEEVAALVGLTDLNFAGQFDRPYLLDATSGQVARMLGKLTNVDLVFEAARLGYARKQETTRSLRRTREEIEQLDKDIAQYDQLPAQLAAAERAEQALARAQACQHRLDQVTTLLERAISWHRQAHQAGLDLAAAEPPSLVTADALAAKHARISQLIATVTQAHQDITGQAREVEVLDGLLERAHDDIHTALVQAGTCPTCGLAVPR